ncbi:MAG: lipid-A-disaccharide synthase [candidate division Zixibacteria bacterium]|nr:lipid-A-disaccharide synthase [candidate division Zixibacteria bacterium]
MLFISAGDPSGDIAGGHLLKCLRKQNPKLQFFGLGGYTMAALGQKQIVEGSKLAVLGFWEVAKRFLFFRKLMALTIKEIKQRKPEVIILIDYPGFNLRLAEKIWALHIPVIYYISPQIWAWGGKRIKKIKKIVDQMLLILPFEKEIYDRAGIKNRFVGHYLLDDIDSRFIKAPYNPQSNMITLLPGSRPQEIEKMLPVLIETAALLSADNQWRFAIAAVGGDIDYTRYLFRYNLPIEIIKGKTRELIAESRLVITSSGTATLETGIIGRPMVVIYKTGWLTYAIARRLVKIDKIALINIAAGRKIVPELIQSDALPERIAEEARRILNSEILAQDIVAKLNLVTDTLGTPGASERTAQSIGEYIKC